jgi:hypothetical protein
MKTLLQSVLLAGALFLNSCNDACDDVLCKNGATAVANGKDCTCKCAPGYEGQFCETQTRQKILGNFKAVANCPGVTIEKDFTIIPSGTYENRVHIGLVYYKTACGPVTYPGSPYAIVYRNTLTIPEQPYKLYGKDYTIAGSGTIDAGSDIVINLDINPVPADSCFQSCSLVLTKI